jgi:polyphosphate kinase
MKERLLKLIDQELSNHQQGLPAHIIIKANSLEEPVVCRALSKAAQAGVQIDLIIRGICCLRPLNVGGRVMPQVSSIVGRFLEHSRVFYFRAGAPDPIDGQMFIGSADIMHRNLHRRVEVAAPLLERHTRERCWEILQIMLRDQRQAWDLQPDGTYVQRKPSPDGIQQGSQYQLMKLARERSRAAVGGVTSDTIG